MKEKFRKLGSILKRAFIVLVGLLLVSLLGITIWSKVCCINEDEALSKVGKTVNVNGRNIRVSVTGKGEKTIILLSGLGTPSPITDFKPLAEQLGRHYQVVTLEYAGYGLSEDSDEPRTSQTFTKEIRDTLRQLNIKPPYILMPHSISGIYCLQYMKSYPKEVEAMIGIDASVPNQEKKDSELGVSEGLYNLARFMDATGLTRISNLSGVEMLKDMQASGSYTEVDMKNVTALVNRSSITKARYSEIKLLKNNCKALYDTKYPDNIPVLFILSKNSCKQEPSWVKLHKEVISNPEIQKITYLAGNHYLHWTQSKAIAEMADQFLSNSR